MKHILILFLFIMSARSQENNPTNADQDSLIAAAREIMSLQKYCALATIDSSGYPDLRTMNPFPSEEDMTVWMATNSRSSKVQEIRKNPKVCLYFADHSKPVGYVTITGIAVLVDDMNEKLKRKREYWSQAFPDWKYLILIKVIPERLEVINYKQGKLNDPMTWSAPIVVFSNPK